ncbi:hypothetical protein B649_05495 [Candidatus Sulfuricurvum sp. RIFRC-1]|nr:hypothetical protein [Candidatus Sulfuricurvum sp. RIFRC-1]AFV97413.1 hypothetical protein B649_05495 [Candidatus Sulfuricurvum sp. RIFRC-1]
MNDKEHASANFGEFILRWSGFYDMAASKELECDITITTSLDDAIFPFNSFIQYKIQNKVA